MEFPRLRAQKSRHVVCGIRRTLSLFPTASVIEQFRNELKGYRISEGTIQFPIDEPPSASSLIKKACQSATLSTGVMIPSEGGHHASRTGVEGCVGGGRIAVYSRSCSADNISSRESLPVPMIMSIYVTLGIFLLLAVRDPAPNRGQIALLRRMEPS